MPFFLLRSTSHQIKKGCFGNLFRTKVLELQEEKDEHPISTSLKLNDQVENNSHQHITSLHNFNVTDLTITIFYK